MRALRNFMIGAVAVLTTAGLVQPADATQFKWSQNAGFLLDPGGTTAIQSGEGPQTNNTPPLFGGPGPFVVPRAGQGGLEFFFDLFASDTNFPPATYRVVGWGCTPDGNNDPGIPLAATTCAQGASTTIAPFGIDPLDDSAATVALRGVRSALHLDSFDSETPDFPTYGSQILDSVTENVVVIAQINHHNRTIDNEANTLWKVRIQSNLIIKDLADVVIPTNDPFTNVDIAFRETLNTVNPSGSTTPDVTRCAQPNPLGSVCDDQFTFVGNFTNVEFEYPVASNTKYFLQFGLAPIPACDTPAGPPVEGVQIYICDDDSPATPHRVALDFGAGRAWASEGTDNAFLVTMKVTAVPVGGNDGCTPGYWKQKQHFGSYAVPFSPNQTLAAAFSAFGGSPNFPKVKNKPDIDETAMTLVQALGQGGGGTNALLRHFIAAVLNAANNNVNSQFENIQELVDAVKAVLPGGSGQATLGGQIYTSVESLKNALAASNEGGCTLGRDPGDNI